MRLWRRKVNFTIKPKTDRGEFSVVVSEARGALEFTKRLLENGVEEVEVLGDDGVRYGMKDLEDLALKI